MEAITPWRADMTGGLPVGQSARPPGLLSNLRFISKRPQHLLHNRLKKIIIQQLLVQIRLIINKLAVLRD